jgi:hypothetical protein
VGAAIARAFGFLFLTIGDVVEESIIKHAERDVRQLYNDKS